MASLNDRFADNVVGAFYVDEACICCMICAETAPSVFQESEEGGHHIVYHQPSGEEEVALALEALEGCPVEAIGRDG